MTATPAGRSRSCWKRILFGCAVAGAVSTVTSCGEGDESEPPPPACEFSGITPRDETGSLTGPEDTDDWCADVAASPNPASDVCQIRFDLATAQPVRIAVHSIDAADIVVLVESELPAGRHVAAWDLTANGVPLPKGLYCITVSALDYNCHGDVEIP